MGFFKTKEEKEAIKQKEAEVVKALLDHIDATLAANTAEENKYDLKVIINSLVGFFAQENPNIFKKGVSDAYVAKEFFKTIVSVGMDSQMPHKQKENELKIEKFKAMFPVIKKYGNVE